MAEEKASETESEAPQPHVYVIEHQPFDYSPAAAYGLIQFLDIPKLAPSYGGEAPDKWNAATVQDVRKQLKDYIPGHDFLLPTGSPLTMMLVAMVLPEKGQRHQFLKWDARAQRYIEYSIKV